jgi:hypothetical protein
MIFIDLSLRLAKRGRGGKRLGHGLPVHSGGEANLGIVARIVGFGAVAGRLTATASYGAD